MWVVTRQVCEGASLAATRCVLEMCWRMLAGHTSEASQRQCGWPPACRDAVACCLHTRDSVRAHTHASSGRGRALPQRPAVTAISTRTRRCGQHPCQTDAHPRHAVCPQLPQSSNVSHIPNALEERTPKSLQCFRMPARRRERRSTANEASMLRSPPVEKRSSTWWRPRGRTLPRRRRPAPPGSAARNSCACLTEACTINPPGLPSRGTGLSRRLAAPRVAAHISLNKAHAQRHNCDSSPSNPHPRHGASGVEPAAHVRTTKTHTGMHAPYAAVHADRSRHRAAMTDGSLSHGSHADRTCAEHVLSD